MQKQKRKRRSSGSRGKQKGAAHERHVCQRLSLWVSDLTREDCFWRSAMSGGRATLKSRKACKGNGKIKNPAFGAQSGDVTATHRMGNLLIDLFVVECKFWKDLEVQRQVFGRPGGKISRFYREVKDIADRSEREPMLIARQNNQPDLCCTSKAGWELLKLGAVKKLPVQAIFPRSGMRVMLLRDVLMTNFGRIRKAIRNRD